jgi:hypothetical protein
MFGSLLTCVKTVGMKRRGFHLTTTASLEQFNTRQAHTLDSIYQHTQPGHTQHGQFSTPDRQSSAVTPHIWGAHAGYHPPEYATHSHETPGSRPPAWHGVSTATQTFCYSIFKWNAIMLCRPSCFVVVTVRTHLQTIHLHTRMQHSWAVREGVPI